MKDSSIIIRSTFFSFAFLTLGFLLFRGFVPFGHISYAYKAGKESFFISRLSPPARMGSGQDSSERIIANPVYFSLHTPRRFDKAKLNIIYRAHNLSFPIIEGGAMVDGRLWRYELKPIENKIVDDICSAWQKQEYDNLVFCQKEKIFSDLDSFLASSTGTNQIALYNYKLDREFLLPDYASSSETTIVDIPLIGNYQFYAYLKDEPFRFRITYNDRNAALGADPIDINVYYEDTLVHTDNYPDDGDASDRQMAGGEKELKLDLGIMPAGVYKIEFRSNDDIITKKIISETEKIAFINRLNLAKTEKKEKLYTDSRQLEALTINPDRLQTIRFGKEELTIDETYKQFSLRLDPSKATSGPLAIELNGGGLAISGNGVFCFSLASYFNPNFLKADQNLDLKNPELRYLVAGYQTPKEYEGWKHAEIEIDLSRAYRENRRYAFMLSVPGLRADDDIEDYIEISSIKADLYGQDLFALIRSKLAF